jgi:pimeloyl-ACP methyl ester carboxylesterase
MRKDIPNFTLPVCLIWGKQDTITPLNVGEEFNTLFPDSELHIIDECGHAPMMEQPQQFNRIATQFYNKLFNNNN